MRSDVNLNLGKYRAPWYGYMKPFKIWGNLYFVGTIAASTHILDTGDGLIMFDSGYDYSLYLVLHNMYQLGLNPLDIKYIVHTHGHIDHLGATFQLINLTGAKTVLGEADRDYANGKENLTWADELGLYYVGQFEPDILINDGDEIRLGNSVIKAMATPGHTPGAMSYFFDVTDGKKTYRAALHGGMGTGTMEKQFLDKYGLSYEHRELYLDACDRLAKEKVDIYLGNHANQSRTSEKYEKLISGDEEAFVNPNDWAKAVLESKEIVKKIIENEAKAQ